MIRREAAAVLLVSAVLLAACGSSSSPSGAAGDTSAIAASRGLASSVDSGVRVRIVIGPTCPVERVGQSCVRPYQATIAILREPTRRIATRARSDMDGHLTVHLTPGRYLLEPQAGHPFPTSRAQSIVVYAHRFTSVTINYDSGIR
jgi:hypothetical protein